MNIDMKGGAPAPLTDRKLSVFGSWDDGPYVVGVVSGESSSENFVAGGSALTGLVRRARNEHP